MKFELKKQRPRFFTGMFFLFPLPCRLLTQKTTIDEHMANRRWIKLKFKKPWVYYASGKLYIWENQKIKFYALRRRYLHGRANQN